MGMLLFVFPFAERSQYKKDLKEYRATLAQLETARTQSVETNMTFDFPPQPLGPPYPATWSELLEWVGPADQYGASMSELGEFKEELHLRNGGLMDMMGRLGLHELKERQEITPLAESDRSALGDFIQLNRGILDRLHGIRQVNGIYFDPHFTAKEFKKLNRRTMRRWHRQTAGRLPILLYLETVHLSESGRDDDALDSILTTLRLSEHLTAGWKFITYSNLDLYRHLPAEYVLNKNRLSAEQLESLIDSMLEMEQRIDYTNALISLQITSHQNNLLGNDRIKPFSEEPELSPEASLKDKIEFSWKKIRYHTLNSAMGLTASHQFFLKSASRYRYQSMIVKWCMAALDARHAPTFIDASKIMSVDDGLPDSRSVPYEDRDRKLDRARSVHRQLWRMMGEKYDLVAQIRLIRAGGMMELYKLKYGEYAQTLEQAAQELGLSPPLDNLTNQPLKVVYDEHGFQIEANRSEVFVIRDKEILAQILAVEYMFRKFTFRRFTNAPDEKATSPPDQGQEI
jgi:hypothetical protein